MAPTITRVVSLLPSATDTLNALMGRCGPDERLPFELCAVSHECEVFTEGARVAMGDDLPRVTSSRLGDIPIEDIQLAFNSSLTALMEFTHLSKPLAVPLLQFGLSAYEIDISELQRIKPDVIITCLQTAHSCILEGELATHAFESVLGYVPKVVHSEGQNLADVYEDMIRISEAVGMESLGMDLVKDMREEMEAIGAMVRQQIGQSTSVKESGLTMSLIWWTAPVIQAGAWVIDMIDMMGVRNIGGDWEQADVVVWSLCGLGVDIAESEARKLVARRSRIGEAAHESPQTSRAVSDSELVDKRQTAARQRMAAVDGIRLFSRPGPLLLESMARLADILLDPTPRGQSWRLLTFEP